MHPERDARPRWREGWQEVIPEVGFSLPGASLVTHILSPHASRCSYPPPFQQSCPELSCLWRPVQAPGSSRHRGSGGSEGRGLGVRMR